MFKTMSSSYKNYISAYPQMLFFGLIAMCRAYNVSYAYAFIGYICNVIVNFWLKHVFRIAIGDAGKRPAPCHFSHNPLDKVIISMYPSYKDARAYGFPSGHAQAVGYFMAFAHRFLPWRKWHWGWIVAALLTAAWLMYTRIAFRCHTAVQVLFGFAFGIATFLAFDWSVKWFSLEF